MRKNRHYDKESDKDNIEISANTNTFKSEIILKNNYEVDFRQDKSIYCHLEFDSKLNAISSERDLKNILSF